MVLRFRSLSRKMNWIFYIYLYNLIIILQFVFCLFLNWLSDFSQFFSLFAVFDEYNFVNISFYRRTKTKWKNRIQNTKRNRKFSFRIIAFYFQSKETEVIEVAKQNDTSNIFTIFCFATCKYFWQKRWEIWNAPFFLGVITTSKWAKKIVPYIVARPYNLCFFSRVTLHLEILSLHLGLEIKKGDCKMQVSKYCYNYHYDYYYYLVQLNENFIVTVINTANVTTFMIVLQLLEATK